MRDRQTCIDCAKLSPETETNYTLISAQFGWRLTRRRLIDGAFAVEWRCPECWRVYKNSRGANDPVAGWPGAPGEGPGAPPPSRRIATPTPFPAVARPPMLPARQKSAPPLRPTSPGTSPPAAPRRDPLKPPR